MAQTTNLINMRFLVGFLAAMLLLIEACLAGEGLLTGRYEYRTDKESLEIIGDLICFYPDAYSANFLNRSNQDKRLLWLCFSNGTQAKRLLDVGDSKSYPGCGVSGQVTVRIANYKKYLGEGEGVDTAEIQSVNRRSDVKTLHCI